MAAAAIAFAELSQIDQAIGFGPGIRADRDLDSEAALAQAHTVDALWVQIVGDKLVVALQVLIGHVEKNRPIPGFAPLLKNAN